MHAATATQVAGYSQAQLPPVPYQRYAILPPGKQHWHVAEIGINILPAICFRAPSSMFLLSTDATAVTPATSVALR